MTKIVITLTSKSLVYRHFDVKLRRQTSPQFWRHELRRITFAHDSFTHGRSSLRHDER